MIIALCCWGGGLRGEECILSGLVHCFQVFSYLSYTKCLSVFCVKTHCCESVYFVYFSSVRYSGPVAVFSLLFIPALISFKLSSASTTQIIRNKLVLAIRETAFTLVIDVSLSVKQNASRIKLSALVCFSLFFSKTLNPLKSVGCLWNTWECSSVWIAQHTYFLPLSFPCLLLLLQYTSNTGKQ